MVEIIVVYFNIRVDDNLYQELDFKIFKAIISLYYAILLLYCDQKNLEVNLWTPFRYRLQNQTSSYVYSSVNSSLTSVCNTVDNVCSSR